MADNVSYQNEDLLRFTDVFHDANRQANEFARTGLANLMLLNGGAIIAFAPIGSMFGVSVKDSKIEIISILSLYVLGLVCGIASYLLGFFVNLELSEMAQLVITGQPVTSVEVTRVRHNRFRKFGICSALVGFFAFIIAAIVGVHLLLK